MTSEIKFKTSLLPHQKEAADKLIGLKIGALYMEMGTGKTRTALELAVMRMNAGKIDQVLWMPPCSVKRTIKREIDKHVDGDEFKRRVKIVGTETLSQSTREMCELERYVAQGRTQIVIDESLLIKNHLAKRTERVTELAQQCPYREILNGTPISKNEKDLFAQWYALDWRVLGYRSFWSFAKNHIEYDPDHPGKIRRMLNVDTITNKIAPFTYQVLKSECLELPEKNETYWDFSLTDEQREHYYRVMNRYFDACERDEDDETHVYRLFNACQQIACGMRVLSSPYEHMRTVPFFDDPTENPRIQELLRVVDAIADDSKIIVWCKYTHEIDDICKVLEARYGQGCAVRYNGEISQRKRNESEDKFERDPYVRFFVGNRACGKYGLNLQHCHEMIYYSNDWDYGTKAQSEDRAHRIGQTERLHIVNLVALGTIDERIIDCLARKGNLSARFKDSLSGKMDMRAWLLGMDEEDMVS